MMFAYSRWQEFSVICQPTENKDALMLLCNVTQLHLREYIYECSDKWTDYIAPASKHFIFPEFGDWRAMQNFCE